MGTSHPHETMPESGQQWQGQGSEPTTRGEEDRWSQQGMHGDRQPQQRQQEQGFQQQGERRRQQSQEGYHQGGEMGGEHSDPNQGSTRAMGRSEEYDENYRRRKGKRQDREQSQYGP